MVSSARFPYSRLIAPGIVLTVQIGANIQHVCLAGCDGLRKPKNCCAQRCNGQAILIPVLGQNFGRVESWSSRRYFDAISTPIYTYPGEFLIKEARMVNGGLLVVRLGGRRLQQDTTLDVVNVLFAQQYGLKKWSAQTSCENSTSTYHSCIYVKPALIFELFRRLDNEVCVRLVVKLDVNPQLIAR